MTQRLVQFTCSEDPLVRTGVVMDVNTVAEVRDLFHPEAGTGNTYPLPEVSLKPPLPGVPSKIIAVGLNYPAHIDEMKHETVPEDPVLFLKAPSSVIAPGQPIQACEAWGNIDYEGELAVVIGKPCKNVSKAEALTYVLGYTLANDVTARTLQRKDTQWGRAKNFDTFCPVGPTLLWNDGQDPAAFRLQTRVNGQVVQDALVGEMRFSVPDLIAYISGIMTLLPGDVILTGTPRGVGPLQAGQTVEISVAEIGSLTNLFEWIPSPVCTVG